MRPHKLLAFTALLLAGLCLCGIAVAQELTPRAYWPFPNGTNVFGLAYQHTGGDVVTDASLPLAEVKSDINLLQASYQRTFSLFGRTASVNLTAPYSRGSTEGLVENEFRRRELSGMVDSRIRFSINLKGAPSMDAAGFRELIGSRRTIVGASLLLQAPTGAYEPDKLINLGSNRWSAKPAIGMIIPLRPNWLLELELGAWLFGNNNDFLGTTLEQSAILSTEVHLVKIVRPDLWLSLDANYYYGGQTKTADSTQNNQQRNSRLGGTLVFPIKGRHALRGTYSTSLTTHSGGNYEKISLSYLYVW